MKISWFTVIAEVINFLVLVWLLRKFLYKPILQAVDQREKKIASEISDADKLKAEAKKEQDDLTKKNTEFDQQKKALMEKAVSEVAARRETLLTEAKEVANKLSDRLEASSKEKQKTEHAEFARKAKREVFAITRKALAEIASVSLEEQSVEIFINRLNDLQSDEKRGFIDAFKSKANTIQVKSAFEIPVKQRACISKAVDAILETQTAFQFNTAPGIVSGIELTTNGYKLAWSLSEFLDSLEKNFLDTVNENSDADPEKKTTSDQKAKPEKQTATVEN